MSLLPVLFRDIAEDVRPPRVPIKIETEDPDDIEIIGKRGGCIDLAYSQSVSVTFQEKQAEQFRIFDKVRVTNPRRVPASALDTPKLRIPVGVRQYVDQEIMHYIQYRNEFGHLVVEKFRKPEHFPSQGLFVIEENIKKSIR
jgi:hypothetical protein